MAKKGELAAEIDTCEREIKVECSDQRTLNVLVHFNRHAYIRLHVHVGIFLGMFVYV